MPKTDEDQFWDIMLNADLVACIVATPDELQQKHPALWIVTLALVASLL